MPEDDYGDSIDEKPSMGGKDQETEEKDETALIPKSLLAGKKFDVGSEVILKIVADHGGEIEVEYAHGDDKEEKGEGSQMEKSSAKMESMGTTGDY